VLGSDPKDGKSFTVDAGGSPLAKRVGHVRGFSERTIWVNPHDGDTTNCDRGAMAPTPTSVIVVLPLRDGCESRARELATSGPPFDPQELPLESHELFLTSNEAVFVFESRSGTTIESLLDTLDIWAAATTWRDLVAGPPRLASPAYSWHRPPSHERIGLGL
jgi:hypothetical protein